MRNLRQYRPAGAAFLLAIAMALTTTAVSFFVVPVCEELGLGRGEFTVYFSLMTAAGALSVAVLGQIIQKRGVRPIAAVSAVWVAAGFVVFSFSKSLWVFYVAGGLIGLFGTACVTLCASIIVGQSYSRERASGILGVVMSGSGLGGMLISMVLPGLIRELGWRWGYRTVALCWLILGLGAWALLENGGQSRSELQEAEEDGMTRSEALRCPKLYLLLVVSFIVSAACGIQQQLPSVLSGYGYSAGRVGAFMSLFTASLALGKIGQGFLYGRIGAVRGGVVVTALFAASFVLLLFPGMVWLGLPALAVGMGMVTTWLPMLTRLTFGNREYAPIWGVVYSASNAGTLVAAPLFGLSYDSFGSYAVSMAVTAPALLLSLVLTWLCFRKNP